MVAGVGFEPTNSRCVSRVKCHFSNPLYMLLATGLEPVWIAPRNFKPLVSTIPPHKHFVMARSTGVEPVLSDRQSDVITPTLTPQKFLEKINKGIPHTNS